MKLMWSLCCATLVVPDARNRKIRWCECKKSACWWNDADAGLFVVHAEEGAPIPDVLGLHNGLLTIPYLPSFQMVQRGQIEKLLEDTPDTYLFKRANSVLIRFKPGISGDTRFTGKEEVEQLQKKEAAEAEAQRQLMEELGVQELHKLE